jgi:hypothetical protein
VGKHNQHEKQAAAWCANPQLMPARALSWQQPNKYDARVHNSWAAAAEVVRHDTQMHEGSFAATHARKKSGHRPSPAGRFTMTSPLLKSSKSDKWSDRCES